ncbi:MAG: hypothetical protein MUO85_02260 [candidate division Zixibacteria bacterium]|nr:hypothetical protein [candidate division Zixibacteria bacterium]
MENQDIMLKYLFATVPELKAAVGRIDDVIIIRVEFGILIEAEGNKHPDSYRWLLLIKINRQIDKLKDIAKKLEKPIKT